MKANVRNIINEAYAIGNPFLDFPAAARFSASPKSSARNGGGHLRLARLLSSVASRAARRVPTGEPGC